MPTSKMKIPSPAEPGIPENPPMSLNTPADNHTNQAIAGAGSPHSTAPDGAVEHFADPRSDSDTPIFPFSATYSTEIAVSGLHGPESPENRSMRRICAERPQADLSGADVEDTIPGFAVPDLASHLPDGEIVVDTGWTDAGGRQFRAVFCAGSQAPLLRSWIVDLMLAGGIPEMPEFPMAS